MMNKRTFTLLWATLLSLIITAQELPQFAFNDFEGWTYSGGALTEDDISRGIYLYVTSQGHVLTLTSPTFSCNGIDSIDALVRWRSSSPDIGLTVILDDAQGTPLDSVTSMPASSSSSQKLTFSIAVPAGLSEARLRFVSLDADVTNCGAVRSIELSAVTSSVPTIPGDVNYDGVVDIIDVTMVIDYVLGRPNTGCDPAIADVDHNGDVSINDITALINMVLKGY